MLGQFGGYTLVLVDMSRGTRGTFKLTLKAHMSLEEMTGRRESPGA